MPLQIGKTPIVVPRQHQYNEHVNDHQVEFARNVAQRMGTIIEVEGSKNKPKTATADFTSQIAEKQERSGIEQLNRTERYR